MRNYIITAIHGISDEELYYGQDLALLHHSMSWHKAKLVVSSCFDEPTGIDYWLAVRVVYFKLGGRYVEDLEIHERIIYSHRKEYIQF